MSNTKNDPCHVTNIFRMSIGHMSDDYLKTVGNELLTLNLMFELNYALTKRRKSENLFYIERLRCSCMITMLSFV